MKTAEQIQNEIDMWEKMKVDFKNSYEYELAQCCTYRIRSLEWVLK